MNLKLRTILGASVLTLAAATAAEAAHTGFALGSGGTTLVRFDPANPAGAMETSLSGDGVRLDAIDFRPATGELFGYDSAADAYYIVNPNTGALTQVDNGMVVATTGGNLDIDWNPTIDRMRTVTSGDQNIVFNPNDGSTTAATDLFYAMGDANEGVNPSVVANAYTNSFAGNFGGTTVQYVLDSGTDSLATLANNAGTLSTIAELTVNGSPLSFDNDAGFDIFFNAGASENIPYALLTSQGLTSLFILDLTTGAATLVGSFARSFGNMTGLAFGVVNEIPIPAALPLFFAGLGGLTFAARRRKKVAG